MMSIKFVASVTSLFLLATPALAKTDLQGCTYSDSVYTPGHGTPYATRVWFVEDTGEICEFLDCGGGRAPPKTTVPGCGSYEGTDTYSPRFLAVSTTIAAAESTPEAEFESATTEAPTLEVSTSSSPEPQVTSASEAESSKKVSTQTESEPSAAAESSQESLVESTSGGSAASVITTTPTSTTESADESEATGQTAGASTTDSPNAANAMATGGARDMIGLLAGVAMGAALW